MKRAKEFQHSKQGPKQIQTTNNCQDFIFYNRTIVVNDALPTGPRFWYYVGTPREDVPVCEVDIQTKHTPRPDFTPDNGPEPAHKPSSHSNEQSSPASTRPPTPPSKVPKPRRGWEHVEDGPHEQTKKHQDHELEAANKLGDEMADEDLALQRAEEEDLQMQKAQGDHHEEDMQEKLEKQERSDAALTLLDNCKHEQDV